MPVTKLLVFVSSTSDLLQERDAVERALPMSFASYRYEKDRARGESPREHLAKALGDSDVFVGILGARYGSVYPDCEDDPSIVQWEFETARSMNRAEIMAFKKDVDESSMDSQQKSFVDGLAEFKTGIWMKSFDRLDVLIDEVKDSLLEWLAEYKNRERESRPRRTGLLFMATALMTLIIMSVLVISRLPEDSRSDLALLCAAAEAVIAGCAFVSWWLDAY